jgi:TolA-binding protein
VQLLTESERLQRLAALLDLATTDLAAGNFAQARSRAEAVLGASTPPGMRATALILAGDAAYGMGAYRMAADSYRQFRRKHESAPEASHAAMALGWAEVRQGRREAARRAWTQLARQLPADPRVPVALILAAELASQDRDTAAARKLLDRVLEGNPTGPDAEIARLNRSILSVGQGRTQEAARDLHVLVQSGRTSVAQQRQRLLAGLTAAGGEVGLERRLTLTNLYDGPLAADEPGRSDEDGVVLAVTRPFERFAAPFLGAAAEPKATPLVLHGLVLAAAEGNAWPEVRTLSNRLVDRFPAYPGAPALLVSVAGRAVSERRWTVARATYETLIARYQDNALTPRARVDVAEALFRTGATTEARTHLTRFMGNAPSKADGPRALFLLAEVNEALDEPRQALAAYERLRRDYPRAEWTAESLLPHARLLQHAIGQQRQARSLLEEIVRRTEGEEFAEASFRLAQVLSGDGEHGRALDWYMTAAYGAAEGSRWHRPALLGAGGSLATLNRTEEALAVYRKLLPSTPLPRLPRDGRSLPVPAEAVGDPELAGEAAHQVADILSGSGRSEEALDMYLAAAYLAPESPWGRRALVGAMRSLVATGDHRSAEALYRRLLGSTTSEPELLAQARKVLHPAADATSTPGR